MELLTDPAGLKHHITDGETPRAVMLLRGMLPDLAKVQHVNREVVKEGDRTVRVARSLRDPQSGEVVGYIGIGHRTLFWREP